MPAIPASVVILTKNEARHVERAVHSATGFDEILVIDSNSTDGTPAKAKSVGAKVVQFVWDGRYPKKKEWALEHCRNDWVIYLDADEYFTPELKTEIVNVVADESVSAFEVPLRYFWLGKELKHGHKVSKRIGMRKENCWWPRPNDLHVKNMWEVEGHYQPQVKTGSVRHIDLALGHDDRDGLYDYFQRHNRYSDWEARMLFDGDAESLSSRSRMGRMAARLPLKPAIFFAYSYVVKLGILDGREGLSYATALSFYYWQINQKIQELKKESASNL